MIEANPDDECAPSESCGQHVRNVWYGGGSKAPSKHINDFLRDNLDKVDPHIWVSISCKAFLQAYCKLFSGCCNYPKGDGEIYIP